MLIPQKAWYLLLPANLIYTMPIFIFGQYFSKGINFHVLNYLSTAYLMIFAAIIAYFIYKSYFNTTNKQLFKCNLFNLAVSVIISFILDVVLEHWKWFFYMLSSWQYLVVVWVGLLIWQYIVRFFLWIKFS